MTKSLRGQMVEGNGPKVMFGCHAGKAVPVMAKRWEVASPRK